MPKRAGRKAPYKRKARAAVSRRTRVFWNRVFPVAAGLALIASTIISVGEYLDWPTPTWHQIYSWMGVDKATHALTESEGARTRIHFIDAGQADATLLEQGGRFALIDAGLTENADGLVEYLRRAGVEELDYVVMTHPHADHIGGMQEVLETYPVGALLTPELPQAQELSQMANGVLDAAREQGIPRDTLDEGDVFPLGEAALNVLQEGSDDGDLNDLSPILRFEAPEVSCLFTGDGESAVENRALEEGLSLRADIFQAGHHGSYTSNSRAFVHAVRPRFVVISCGLDNEYGHPHEAALRAFQSVRAAVYRTDQEGTVVAYVDGEGRLQFAADRTQAVQERAA